MIKQDNTHQDNVCNNKQDNIRQDYVFYNKPDNAHQDNVWNNNYDTHQDNVWTVYKLYNMCLLGPFVIFAIIK